MGKRFPKEDEELFEKSQRYKRNGDYEKALLCMNNFLVKHPDIFLPYMMLGSIYWKMNKLDEAISQFKKGIEKNQNHEKLSLCLFHTLWDKGLRFEALEEMKRFLTNNKSDEYTEILNGITVKLHEKPINTDL